MDFFKIDTPDRAQMTLKGAAEQQSRDAFEYGARQLDPMFGVDYSGIADLVKTNPKGPEAAVQDIILSSYLGTAMGVPIDEVYKSPQTYAASFYGDGVDDTNYWEKFAQNIEADSLAKQRAELYDQLKNLRSQTRLYRAGDTTGLGPDQVQEAEAYTQKMQVQYQQEEQNLLAQIQGMEATLSKNQFKSWTPGWAVDGARGFVQSMVQSMVSPEGITAMGVGILTGGVSAATQAGVKSILSIGRAAISQGVNMASTGVAASMARQVSGDTYGALVESGVTHDVAKVTSDVVALVSGGLEKLQFDAVLGPMDGIITEAVRKAVAQGTKKAVTTGILGNAARQFGARWALNTLEESVVETAQEAAAILGEYIAQEIDAETVDPAKRITMYEAVNRLLETAAVSAAGASLITIPGSAMRTVADAANAKNVQTQALNVATQLPG